MSTVRPLTAGDLPHLERLVSSDPVTHCFVESRVEAATRSGRIGPEWWVVGDAPDFRSALYVGANVIPVESDDAARAEFARMLLRTGRRGSSIVGPADEVLDLWARLSSRWGPARDVRARQPLLSVDHDPLIDPDPLVRAVTMDELDVLLPACVAMFTEEVGVSPVAGGGGAAYRARVAEIVREGRAFARIENDRVVFKAEVGVATSRACQVQGVWVSPERRGQGLSEPGMSAVVVHARRVCAPVVSLYVNDYNDAARRCYEAVGFAQVGTFATVLF